MAKQPVTETNTENMDVNNPFMEIVKFTTQSIDGDYYDSKKFNQIESVFADQETADGNEIRVSFATLANGRQRVTLIPENAVTTGSLIIYGRK